MKDNNGFDPAWAYGVLLIVLLVLAYLIIAIISGPGSNTYNVEIFSPDMAASVEGDGFAVVCTGDCITTNNPAPTPAPAPGLDELETANHRLNSAIMFIGMIVIGLALAILTLGGIL